MSQNPTPDEETGQDAPAPDQPAAAPAEPDSDAPDSDAEPETGRRPDFIAEQSDDGEASEDA